MKVFVDPATKRAARLVAIALGGAAVAFAAFAVTFGSEAGYLQAVGETTPDVGVLAITGSLAFVLLAADIVIAVGLIVAPLRLFFGIAATAATINGLVALWILGAPARALQVYTLPPVPVPLGPAASLAFAMALLGTATALVGRTMTPGRRTWLDAAPPVPTLAVPSETHQA